MPRRPKYKTQLDGLLVVDKPLGLSSMDVVRRVRHAAGFCKTGHAGTLDPLATGVVVCCLGRATRLVESLMGGVKVYEAVVDLSAFTVTDDREGPREEVAVAEAPPLEAVEGACVAMVGSILQKPPAYSAIHVEGQRAYAMARRGEAVDLPARPIIIHSIDILSYSYPLLTLRITCGKGTYIRSIARDLGNALGTGGHLASLRRTAVGRYRLAMAVTMDRLDQPIVESDLIAISEG